MKVYCLSHLQLEAPSWVSDWKLEWRSLSYDQAGTAWLEILEELRSSRPDVLIFDFRAAPLSAWTQFKTQLFPLLPCVGWFEAEAEEQALEMFERQQIQDYILDDSSSFYIRRSLLNAHQTPTVPVVLENPQLSPKSPIISLLDHEHIQGILDMLPQPVFVKNRQHQWVLVNQQFCEFVGQNRQELLGKSDFDFFPEREAKVFWEKDEEVFTTGQGNLNEEEVTDSEDQTHTILTHKVRYQAPNQQLYLIGSITNIDRLKEAQNEVQRLISQIENRVKERTIELEWLNRELGQEIQQRREVENKLTSSLREKELLLQEVYHRVKNNLQVISSMLNLQARGTEESDSLQVLRSTQNRVQAMALVHEKLYESDNLNQINFAEYTRSLSRNLSYTYGHQTDNIRISYALKTVFLSIDIAVPCGLILNELISHSFQSTVQHLEANSQELLRFEIALSLETYDHCSFTLKLTSPIGLEASQCFTPTGLGLRLMNRLIAQIQGEIELGEDQVQLRFPLQKEQL